MKIQGLEILSKKQIRDRAISLLEHFHPGFFEAFSFVPLKEIVAYLQDEHQFIFHFNYTLGFNKHNHRILGACNPSKRIILIDQALEPYSPKFNFTLGHEIAHLVLHRKLSFSKDESKETSETETVVEKPSSKNVRNDEGWMEWQANCYSSALLMPEILVRRALIRIQNNKGISKAGTIVINSQGSSMGDFLTVLSEMASFFNVSNSAMEYQLRDLKLINDQRTSSFKTIGSHLRNDNYL